MLSRLALPDKPLSYPLLSARLLARPDRAWPYPDAVIDQRRLGARQALERLAAMRAEGRRRGLSGDVVLVTVKGIGGSVWVQEDHARWRALSRKWAAGFPCEVAVEADLNLEPHMHVLALREAVGGFPEGSHVLNLLDPERFVRNGYLRKPVLASVCRKNYRRAISEQALAEASELYLQARLDHFKATGSRRLPATHWAWNMPAVEHPALVPSWVREAQEARSAVLSEREARWTWFQALLVQGPASTSPARSAPLCPLYPAVPAVTALEPHAARPQPPDRIGQRRVRSTAPGITPLSNTATVSSHPTNAHPAHDEGRSKEVA